MSKSNLKQRSRTANSDRKSKSKSKSESRTQRKNWFLSTSGLKVPNYFASHDYFEYNNLSDYVKTKAHQLMFKHATHKAHNNYKSQVCNDLEETYESLNTASFGDLEVQSIEDWEPRLDKPVVVIKTASYSSKNVIPNNSFRSNETSILNNWRLKSSQMTVADWKENQSHSYIQKMNSQSKFAFNVYS